MVTKCSWCRYDQTRNVCPDRNRHEWPLLLFPEHCPYAGGSNLHVLGDSFSKIYWLRQELVEMIL